MDIFTEFIHPNKKATPEKYNCHGFAKSTFLWSLSYIWNVIAVKLVSVTEIIEV